MERLAKAKHSSLLQTLVSYGRKEFYNIGPCPFSVHYKYVMLKNEKYWPSILFSVLQIRVIYKCRLVQGQFVSIAQHYKTIVL
jgi:hypothetical protein